MIKKRQLNKTIYLCLPLTSVDLTDPFCIFIVALVYAELGSSIKESGGDWAYNNAAFAPLHPKLGELPAFLQSWTKIIAVHPASLAIQAITFTTYFLPLFFDNCGPPDTVVKLTSILVISK